MKLISLLFLFITPSLYAQEDLSEFLPTDYNTTEAAILKNFRKIKIAEPNFEKLYCRKNWVFPMYYDTLNNICKATCYYNGEEHELVGQKVATDLKSYYFGVLTKNDEIVNTARWEENNTPYSTDSSSYLKINLIYPKSSGGNMIRVRHISDNICMLNDELRIFSERQEKVRDKIRSYYNENPPNPNPFSRFSDEYYYAGDTSAIYWVEVGQNLWGELLIGTERYEVTGEIINKKLIFNVYRGQSVGMVNLTVINSEKKTLIFKDDCFTQINERIYKKEISSISDKFGDVYLPSQNLGVGSSAGGESIGSGDGN